MSSSVTHVYSTTNFGVRNDTRSDVILYMFKANNGRIVKDEKANREQGEQSIYYGR